MYQKELDVPSTPSQVESETANSEFKLNNATQRLLQLEKNLDTIKMKAQTNTLSAEQMESLAKKIGQEAEQVRIVCTRDKTDSCFALPLLFKT